MILIVVAVVLQEGGGIRVRFLDSIPRRRRRCNAVDRSQVRVRDRYCVEPVVAELVHHGGRRARYYTNPKGPFTPESHSHLCGPTHRSGRAVRATFGMDSRSSPPRPLRKRLWPSARWSPTTQGGANYCATYGLASTLHTCSVERREGGTARGASAARGHPHQPPHTSGRQSLCDIRPAGHGNESRNVARRHGQQSAGRWLAAAMET